MKKHLTHPSNQDRSRHDRDQTGSGQESEAGSIDGSGRIRRASDRQRYRSRQVRERSFTDDFDDIDLDDNNAA